MGESTKKIARKREKESVGFPAREFDQYAFALAEKVFGIIAVEINFYGTDYMI